MPEKTHYSFDLKIEQRNLIFFRLLLFIFGLLLSADLYALYAIPQFGGLWGGNFMLVLPLLLSPVFFIQLMYKSWILIKKQHIYLLQQGKEDLLAVLQAKQKILFWTLLMLGITFLMMCFSTQLLSQF